MNIRSFAAAVVATLAIPVAVSAQAEPDLEYHRPYDKQGINVFEQPQIDDYPFDGLDVNLGAAFTQQFQALDHTNSDDAVTPELIEIGSGFNLATANLYLDAQLADGIGVHLTTYLSSRHHPEAWVKSGYLLVDELPMIESDGLDRIMEYVTVKAGHFEINYGDAHFRRTDNGNAMHNPLVGNWIMDSFTTEIGGEVYVRTPGGFLGMLALTGGEIRGAVENPDARSPSFYGKVGFDRQFTEVLRARLTGSFYTTGGSINNTLYSGDRAGSRYYLVMEPVGSSAASEFTSGRLNPGFRDEVTAFMVNPFLKAGGFEFFGIGEWASGRAQGETGDRDWSQYSGEATYRFFDDESLYATGRYTAASGDLQGLTDEVSVDRVQVGGGWFLTRNIQLKAEWVRQSYSDFPVTDIRAAGEFDGFMVEGVVAF
ncbi:MAG: hypothetical protein ACOC8K_07460 [Gemmatimonadota bacterium]